MESNCRMHFIVQFFLFALCLTACSNNSEIAAELANSKCEQNGQLAMADFPKAKTPGGMSGIGGANFITERRFVNGMSIDKSEKSRNAHMAGCA